MGKFNNELEIDELDVFKNDKLGREKEIKNLTELFEIVENQMVLSINSSWGTGKSSFLSLWNKYLQKKEYKTVFFNAWENDFVDEPFTAIVSEITENLECIDKEALKDSANNLVNIVFKNSSKILRDKAIEVIQDKYGIEVNEILKTITSDCITEYKQQKENKLFYNEISKYKSQKNAIRAFKDKLQEITNMQDKPLIIFIDELDRCRPDYAVRLLERIKHIFNVKNVIFILGIDKVALANSIKVLYGNDTDINGYLARFIDMEYKLNNSEDIRHYVRHLIDKYELQSIYSKGSFALPENTFKYSKENGSSAGCFLDFCSGCEEYDNREECPNIEEYEFCEYVQNYHLSYVLYNRLCESIFWYIERAKISLRECEKIIFNVYIILKISLKINIDNEDDNYPYIFNFVNIIVFLCVIKSIDYRLFNKIKEFLLFILDDYEHSKLEVKKRLWIEIKNNKKIGCCFDTRYLGGIEATAYILWLLKVDNDILSFIEDEEDDIRDKIIEKYQEIIEQEEECPYDDFELGIESNIKYSCINDLIISRVEMYNGLSFIEFFKGSKQRY